MMREEREGGIKDERRKESGAKGKGEKYDIPHQTSEIFQVM